MKAPNRLLQSASPYLLQHAYNPVDWFPWCDEAFEKARSEDKLVLVSIGYSACHWCHVMEHESFEDDAVAALMNDFFVCIKVDREERPDIDQVYMSAVQLMTGQGGWPLNCFALPDGRPVYGGTYFPKSKWTDVLYNLANLYKTDKSKVLDYASQLSAGVRQHQSLPVASGSDEATAEDVADATVKLWSKHFDAEEGGPNRAPKFPLPNNYLFLLAYAERNPQPVLEDHICLTLKKMAFGGIYDHIGGGFSRYSVDAFWKVPHFEKMLYDNAQLVSLYSAASKRYGDPLYRRVVFDTISFIKRELKGGSGNFLSALDADSEGEEGKFYVWQEPALRSALGPDFELFSEVYNVNETGYWEHGNYILLMKEEPGRIAARHGLKEEELYGMIDSWKMRLLELRNQRIRPGLDDKTIASWNGLMITGLLDAFDAFGEPHLLETALQCARFMRTQMMNEDGRLYHTWKVVPYGNGYLEDYAFVIQSFIRLYQCTFSREWLDFARDLCMYALDHFSDERSAFMYFTSDVDPPLFSRQHELQDNVVPASNSQMALNLYMLGRYYEKSHWVEKAAEMWKAVSGEVSRYGSAWSNWLLLNEFLKRPETELVICGEHALQERKKFAAGYYPFVLLAGCVHADVLPMTLNRTPPQGTAVYKCTDKVCGLPLVTVDGTF